MSAELRRVFYAVGGSLVGFACAFVLLILLDWWRILTLQPNYEGAVWLSSFMVAAVVFQEERQGWGFEAGLAFSALVAVLWVGFLHLPTPWYVEKMTLGDPDFYLMILTLVVSQLLTRGWVRGVVWLVGFRDEHWEK